MTTGSTGQAALAIDARGVHLTYGATTALNGVDLAVRPGERVALMGPSGSGKSSLLHCLAGIIAPDSGTVTVNGRRLDSLSEGARSRARLEMMGVVFQFGDLVAELSLLENVALPLQLLGAQAGRARATAHDLLQALGVDDVADRRAGAVSGGQAQRAAVARAMVHEPAIIFADEPTGSLDTVAAESVLDALVSLAADRGTTLLVVTHDHRVAAHLDRCITMVDGRVTADPDAPAHLPAQTSVAH